LRLPYLFLVAVSILLGVSCTAPPSDPGPLVNVDAWQELGASEDPFALHRPEDAGCPDGGWGAENGVFEVETDRCNYGSFAQPLHRGLQAGTPLRVSVWHLGLFSEEPGEGHAVVLIDGETVFEVQPGIPSEPDIWDQEHLLESSVEQGDSVVFHLHNHGTNSWRLGAIEATLWE